MGRPSTTGTGLKWITIPLEPSLHERAKSLAGAEKVTLQELCIRAIARSINQDITIGEPRNAQPRVPSFPSPSELSFDEYAKDAKVLIVAGTTLKSLTDAGQFAGFLRRLASDKEVSLTFALLGDTILAQPPLIAELERRRSRRSTPSIKEEVATSLAFLSKLKSESPAEIKVLRLNAIPTVGLTIKNPDTPQGQLRVSFHLYKYPDKCDPVLHLSKRDDVTAKSFDLFMAHYRRLAEESTLLL